ncbi:hypothetical protein [Paraburkholderia kururiensis]|uniref:hypothetical protein n=1 Tax=Paraburkholderia kururiensis TaxID=984307 RepID=UPI000B1F01BC|nr:hypothetical protein [Paraburkholderia kururiensis]
MTTVRLNKKDGFWKNITVTNGNVPITFLVNGTKADCEVFPMPPTVAPVQTKKGIEPGNVAKFTVAAGNYKVQINPLGDTSLSNATVSYD